MKLGKIFVNNGGGKGSGPAPEAYRQQAEFLLRVWNEESYGLERIVRLGLCLIQFAFPVLLIRNLSGVFGILGRRLAVEAYTVFKFFFPLAVLAFGWYRHPPVVFLTVYFLADTFVHILYLIFLSDVHSAAVSYRRSLVLIFLHYAEVAFDFAVIYMAFDLLNRPMDAMTAVYFSFVATTTVGFGDVYAATAVGKAVVISQLAVCVVFVVVFINYFSQKINE